MAKKIPACGFAVLVFASGLAHGAVDIHIEPFGPVALGSPQFTVSLPQFDPTLGTLTSVAFELAATSSGGSFAFDNESSSPGRVSLGFGVTVKAETGGPLLTTVNTPLFQVTGTGSVYGDNDAAPNFTGLDSFRTYGYGYASQSVVQNSTDYLSQFTASSPGGSFSVRIDNDVAAVVTRTIGSVMGPTSVSGGVFYGKVIVAYTYTLVPVPEAVTTLWGACLGLFAIGRRRRVQQG